MRPSHYKENYIETECSRARTDLTDEQIEEGIARLVMRLPPQDDRLYVDDRFLRKAWSFVIDGTTKNNYDWQPWSDTDRAIVAQNVCYYIEHGVLSDEQKFTGVPVPHVPMTTFTTSTNPPAAQHAAVRPATNAGIKNVQPARQIRMGTLKNWLAFYGPPGTQAPIKVVAKSCSHGPRCDRGCV